VFFRSFIILVNLCFKFLFLGFENKFVSHIIVAVFTFEHDENLCLMLFFAGPSSLISYQSDHAHGIGMQYSNQVSKLYGMHWMIPCSARSLASSSTTQAHQQTQQQVFNSFLLLKFVE
jgi:hypothetical protein